MSFGVWLTLGVIAAALVLMARTRLPPGVILLGGVILLYTAGVIDSSQALAGFSNSGLFTVAFMYVLVAGIKETGGIDLIIRSVLGRRRDDLWSRVRLLLPVSAMSAFLNNTPVVATYIPAVLSWSRRRGIPASRLLMPMSYAAILGGTCTLLGTSTNLVVNGLLTSYRPELALGLFDISVVGLPVAAAGLVYLLIASRYLLTDRTSAHERFENVRQYTIEMEVEEGGPLVDRTIEQAGLRQLGSLFLVEIDRDGNVIAAPGPGERLRPNDRLVFAGSTNAAVELQQVRGLRPTTSASSSLEQAHAERRLLEVVVSDQCRFIGQRIREGNFRRAYGAAVLAICRSGDRVEGNLGQVELQPADVLLLEARPPFLERHRHSKEFLLISEVDGQARPAHEKAWLAWTILLGVVVTAALGVVDILNAAMLGAAAMLVTRCCSLSAARDGIDTQVLLTIAAAFGIGKALESSGAATLLAERALALAGGDPLLLLVAVYVLVALLTELITNNAAAVLVFPIVVSSIEALGVHLTPYVIALMLAGSASFLTPIGYQTNLMIYGPGGYHLSDYLRLGAGLNVLTGIIAVLVIPLAWPLSAAAG